MANVDLEQAGYLRRLIDLGLSAYPDEQGGFRHAYASGVGLVDDSGSLFRSNLSSVLLSPGAHTTTQQAFFTAYNHSRLALFVNISATLGGSITPSLQVIDAASGSAFTVWVAAAALTLVGTYGYLFSDGAGGAGSWTEKLAWGVPGRNLRLTCTANNGLSLTYSASAEVML